MDKNHRLECGKLMQNESGQIFFICQLCNGEFPALGFFLRHQTVVHRAIQLPSLEDKVPNGAIRLRPLLQPNVAHGAIKMRPSLPTVTHRATQLRPLQSRTAHGAITLQPSQQAAERTLTVKNHPLVVIRRSGATTPQTTLMKERSPIPVHSSSSDESNLPGKFKCKKCRKEFNSLRRLDFHGDLCKPTPRINCDYCSKTFLTTGGLRTHIHHHHKTNIAFVCDACPRSFNMPSELTLHRRTHGTDANIGCDFCDKRFLTKYERANHVKHDHPNDRYRCSKCSFNSKVFGVVKRHQSIVHGIRN